MGSVETPICGKPREIRPFFDSPPRMGFSCATTFDLILLPDWAINGVAKTRPECLPAVLGEAIAPPQDQASLFKTFEVGAGGEGPRSRIRQVVIRQIQPFHVGQDGRASQGVGSLVTDPA